MWDCAIEIISILLKILRSVFLIFENEQFLNLVKFCDVNNWKLYKVYIWASPIFKVFISLNHWPRKILLDIKIFWFSKIKKTLCKIFKSIEIISKGRSQINFEVGQIFFFKAQNYIESSSNLSKISKKNWSRSLRLFWF